MPILDGGPSYRYWSIHMRTYIKSIDVRAWRCVTDGYTIPMQEKDKDGDVIPKPESEYTATELSEATFHEKFPNSIFAHVNTHMFKLI